CQSVIDEHDRIERIDEHEFIEKSMGVQAGQEGFHRKPHRTTVAVGGGLCADSAAQTQEGTCRCRGGARA
ncbi:MAG: hypothetical protein VX255_05230, partial [Candidatus Latescibacterota bacterium]|nr:hypothetical protein [Candidatus Latescibacterota bacterium]